MTRVPDRYPSSTLTHSAQPTCSDGMAASTFACATSGEPQDPQVCPRCTVSTYPAPASNRGGISGYRAKQVTPMRLRTMNDERAQR
jgi:hypothetical protein